MKKIAYVLALSLFILLTSVLTSCAQRQDTAHLRKPPSVLVEETGNITIFTTSKDVGGEDVLNVLSSLLVFGPGVESVVIRPRTIIVQLSDISAQNKKVLLSKVEKLLKLRFNTEEIVFIHAKDYPNEEDLLQVIADSVLKDHS